MPKRSANTPKTRVAAPVAPEGGPLKVGLVLDDSLDTPGGVQKYLLALGGWLTAAGHDVHYLVGQSTQSHAPQTHSLSRNVAVRFNHNSLSLPLPAQRRRVRQLLAAERFDVLHIQTPYSPMLGAKVIQAANSRTAVVGTFHVAPYSRTVYRANQALALLVRRSLRRFDEIASVSPVAQEFAAETYGIQSQVVPNMFDYASFQQAKPWPRYEDGVLNIVFLGRLVERKGCGLLLQAVTEIQHRTGKLPAFRVIVCGQGSLRGQLERFVAKQQLSDIVEFTGYVSPADKPRYYASADITVFPSTSGESFGIVLLEGMASGRAAVLAGDNPGYRSVMAPHPELLFDPRNASELADKLALYLTDARRRRQAQDWGKHYVASFDINVIGPQIVRMYRQALRKRRQA